MPDVLYEEVIEVDERVVLRQDGCQLPRKDSKRIVTGVILNRFNESGSASTHGSKLCLNLLMHSFCLFDHMYFIIT